MTNDFKKETMKVSSGVVALLLIKISHEIGADWLSDLTLVANTSQVVHKGETYLPYGISFSAPKEGGTTASTTITIEDTFRGLTAQLEGVLDEISINIWLVLSTDPEFIEKDYGTFSVDKINITDKNIALSITRTTILRNSLSSHVVTPVDFPGLFLI